MGKVLYFPKRKKHIPLRVLPEGIVIGENGGEVEEVYASPERIQEVREKIEKINYLMSKLEDDRGE
jgi:hypothetical protein